MTDEPEVDLIEEARRAGQAYIDSFGGDLAAVCADLRRRSAAEGRRVVPRSPLPPYPWQIALARVNGAMAENGFRTAERTSSP
jgi:hypothetical protein